MNSIPETDWKYLNRIKKNILNRKHQQIIDKIKQQIENDNDASIKYYKIYKLMVNENETISDCFDDWRRSTLFYKILFLIQNNLLTEEEYSELSEEVKTKIQNLKNIYE